MSSYLTVIKRRLVEIEKQALNPFGASDAVPFGAWWQENFPYFTNRLSDNTPTGLGDDLTLRSYEIIIRLVVAHLNTLDGEAEALLDEMIPVVEDVFERQHWLSTFDEPTAVLDLHPRGAEFRRSSGLRVFENSALGPEFPNQVGVEFTLTVHIYRDIEKAY